MKKQCYVLANMLIVVLFQFGCSRSSSLPNGEVIILSKEPDTNLAHKQYDVEVYKSFFIYGNGYFVKHYHKEKNAVISYTAIFGDSTEFDKAVYNWINDTAVSIRLYNTISKKEKVFKLSGYEFRNSIETVD